MNNQPTDSEKSTTEVLHEVTQSSKDLFASGERVMHNLEQLQNRAEQATDWRAQVRNSPMLALGAAFMGGLLLSRLFTRD